MDNGQIRATVQEALDGAWGPAGTPEVLDRATEVSLRRWRSFERRSKQRRPTAADRIEDLAKGLRDAFETDRHLVGSMMEEYRASARAVAAVLLREPTSPGA